MKSQPQNPYFRTNSENFQPCKEISLNQFQARGNKTLFMLNSSEHEISNQLIKTKMRKNNDFLAVKLSDVAFILLSKISGILTFTSRISFMFS